MKKILTVFAFTALVISLLSGCKSKDAASGGDPKTVLIAFFERMAKKDLEGAAKLATKDSKGTIDMMKKAMDMAESMKGKEKEEDPTEDFRNMKIGEAKIDGDNATVSVSNPKKGEETFDFPLKKEDGNWKVDFSMGTLMKMGMEQAGKHKDDDKYDNNLYDTANSIDKYNDIMNSDSLKKGLEMVDSMMKSLDPEKMKELKEAMEKLKKATN
jgi:hypothetical protein